MSDAQTLDDTVVDRFRWPRHGRRTLSFGAGEHAYHEGDEASALYEVLDGVFFLYKMTMDGGRQLFGLRFKGELFGLGRQARYRSSVVAVRPSRVLRIDRGALDRSLATDARLANQLLDACSDELLRTREQLVIVGCRSSLGRVAAFLIDTADRTAGGGPQVPLPLTRSELGDYLGLTIETVSRAMSRLKALQIVALPRHDTVLILDRARLVALADGLGEGASRGRLTV